MTAPNTARSLTRAGRQRVTHVRVGRNGAVAGGDADRDALYHWVFDDDTPS